MKIYLINTPYRDVYGELKSGVGYYFPLGFGYISSTLLKKGHEVKILDPEVQNISIKDLIFFLKKDKPDIVGISCTTPNFRIASKIAKLIKKEFNIPIVLGGVHASALPTRTLQDNPEFDIITIGEGEISFSEICEYYNHKIKSLDQIKGVAYRKDQKIKITKPQSFIENVDSLPFPARHLVDMERYKPHVHVDIGKKSATILTSRGCPYQCIYCASHLTAGRKYRAHSAKRVIEEINYLVNKYGIQHIVIQDDTFTVDKKRVKNICNGLISKNIKIDWYCFARVDTVSKEILEIMKKAGCYSIGYGIESADENIFKNIKKNITLEQCRNAIKMTNDLKIRTLAFFIFGSPGETKETIEKTMNFAKELDPHLAFYNSLTPFPGTEVYNTHYKPFVSKSDNWDDFMGLGGNTPVIRFSNFSIQELQEALYRGYIRFYLRPKHVLRLVADLKSFSELKVYINGAYSLFKQCFFLKEKSDKNE